MLSQHTYVTHTQHPYPVYILHMSIFIFVVPILFVYISYHGVPVQVSYLLLKSKFGNISIHYEVSNYRM